MVFISAVAFCIISSLVSKWDSFNVVFNFGNNQKSLGAMMPRKPGSGVKNVLGHCHDATTSFSPSRGLVFCAELLIRQAFRHFTYVTTHSPILPLLYIHHSSFSNPYRFSYVTRSSLNSPGEPPMNHRVFKCVAVLQII